MKKYSKHGPMALVKVNMVTFQENLSGMAVYMIRLEGGTTLATTNYHCFLCIRNGEKLRLTPIELQKGDLIWIDLASFSSDGSLIKTV